MDRNSFEKSRKITTYTKVAEIKQGLQGHKSTSGKGKPARTWYPCPHFRLLVSW